MTNKKVDLPTVIIPTAGTGSRLKEYTENFNKSLLPYKDKPIISHIIEKFDPKTKFIIPIGHEQDKVKNFCSLTYPEISFNFVVIDDYESNDSGPGTTLKACRKFINEPFIYIPCDTIFNETLDIVYDEDLYFVKQVDSWLTKEYTTFKLDSESKITDIKFKESVDESAYAFVGVMYIKDVDKFFDKLENSKEIIDGISLNSATKKLDSWIDMGNYDNYKDYSSRGKKFNFAKKDEYTYFANNKVIKYFSDKKIAEKKIAKITNIVSEHSKISGCFPKNLTGAEHWLCYDYAKGQSLYTSNDHQLINKLVDWLSENIWIHSSADLTEDIELFYRKKTLSRLTLFKEKYSNLPAIEYIDNVKVNSIDYYLDTLDWNYLMQVNQPSLIHGDLQYDNIIINENSEFVLIDWRHEFGNNSQIGDLYYDLAKLMGGLIIDYQKIKNNEFDIKITESNKVELNIPHVDNFDLQIKQLENKITEKQYDLKKVKMLIPLIFLNMAPLHDSPFDTFLYYMSLKYFAMNSI